MMEKNKVSVIIPIYNGEKYIENTVKGLLGQNYSNIEIILVDDGSKDNSLVCCEQIAKTDERIIVCHQENQGPSAARNEGIRHATGEYILFSDIDDILLQNAIKENVEIAIRDQIDLVIFGFEYWFVEDGNRTHPATLDYSFSGSDKEFFERVYVDVLKKELLNSPWNKLIKRTLLVENGIWFDERYRICEDMLFIQQVLNTCKKVAYNRSILYKYAIHTTNSLISSYHINFFEALNKCYECTKEYCIGQREGYRQFHVYCEKYYTLAITQIKRICAQKDISKSMKKSLIQTIADHEYFKYASRHITHKGRRMILLWILKLRQWTFLIYMYNR